MVEADAGRIEQVISILLDNALRHTPAGGRIDVALQSTQGEMRVCVRDTGQGIPPQALPHVFERFYRAPTAASVSDGSGLGLSIAQAIVHAHSGRIWAESQPGQGTTMCFALPLVQA
jgi:signal transduction histidine kinase